MTVSVILPLVSEHRMGEYLGLNLIAKALADSGYRVDCVDLNERLVDHLLGSREALSAFFPFPGAGGEETPWSRYFELYADYMASFDSARSLKEKELYDNFFRLAVVPNFRLDGRGGHPDAEGCRRILESSPLLAAFLQSVARELKEQGREAVLISVPHANQMSHALLFSKVVKSAGGNAPVVLGGTAVTLLDDSVLEKLVSEGLMDYYVKFSGEAKTAGLLDDLREWRPVDQKALAARQPVDIDTQVLSYNPELHSTSVPILYSKGCYWGKCSYCSYIYLDPGKLRKKSVDVLLEEMRPFSGTSIRVSLITEALSARDAQSIAQGILDEGLQIRWGAFIRVNRRFDASLFSLLRRSGCIHACVGVESVNDRILKFLNKGYAKEEVVAFFEEARKAGFVFFQVNFIYGSPVASLEDELENIAFISRYKDVIGNIASFHLEITKKSFLGEHLDELGIQVDSSRAAQGIRVDVIPFVPSLSPEEMKVLERAYERAAEYFKLRDFKLGLQGFMNRRPETVGLKDRFLYSQGGRFYLGSPGVLMLREISRELYDRLNSSDRVPTSALSGQDWLTLYELGLLD